jgi:hypothetical protein
MISGHILGSSFLRGRIGLAFFAALILACSDDAVGPMDAPDSVHQFLDEVGSAPLRSYEALVQEGDLVFALVTFGPPQDCPSGCFYARGWILSEGSSIGWAAFPEPPPSDFQNRGYFPDDAIPGSTAIRPELLLRIRSADGRAFAGFARLLACRGATPEDPLRWFASSMAEVGHPRLAFALLVRSEILSDVASLQALASLDPGEWGQQIPDLAQTAFGHLEETGLPIESVGEVPDGCWELPESIH